MTSGIYKIYNKKNKKCYIGSSVNIENRIKTHFRELNAGNHHSPKLQYSWNKTKDRSVFVWEIVETVNEKENLKLVEQSYIDFFDSYDNGYNSCKFVDNPKFTFKNDRKSKAKQRLKEKETELNYWKELAFREYNKHRNDKNIFIRKSFVTQIERYDGYYYKVADFKYLSNVFNFFYENFDPDKYSLSLWRREFSVSKGSVDNSAFNNLNLFVNFQYYYSEKEDKILEAFRDKSWHDQWTEEMNNEKNQRSNN